MITTRNSLATSISASDALFQSQRNRVPAYIENWVGPAGINGATGAAAGDTDNEWLDIRGSTHMFFQIVGTGTFSGTIQGSLNGGVTFSDIVPDVGSNPITANGLYRFTGAYEYVRWHTTAIQAANTVSVSVSFFADA